MTDVLVGYPVRARLPDGGAIAENEDGRIVRLVRIAHDDEREEAALDAWLRAQGEHVQRVVDLGSAPNGDLVAVVPEVPIALPDLLAAAPLDAGEAVTVLIPIAGAVGALHAAGVAHGSLGPAAIGMTSAGAPVLLMPRTATVVVAGEADPRAADRSALVDLARRLLPPPLPDALRAALATDPGGAAVDLLFALAEPRPVLLDRSEPQHATAMPARLVAPASALGTEEPVGRSRPQARWPESLPAQVDRVRGALRRVRPRVWVPAGAVLAALAAAVVLLPGHGAAAGADPVPPVASTPAPLHARPAAPPAPSRASPVPGSTDPVRAAAALLAARSRCLAAGASRCLDAVDAPGSPVDAADRAALAAGVEAPRSPDVEPVLLRASGSTAVLAVGPDTVLEIREPGGWRLRDVIAPAPAPTQMPSEPSKSPSSSRARTAERKRAASAPSTMRWS